MGFLGHRAPIQGRFGHISVGPKSRFIIIAQVWVQFSQVHLGLGPSNWTHEDIHLMFDYTFSIKMSLSHLAIENTVFLTLALYSK